MGKISRETNSLELMQGFKANPGKDAERELVERARSGDQDAFSELVRKHRAQAFGWANTITRDTYLAEDVVQDALIRAFLHLGTLMDTGRFLPWLQRIIRNQAYMKLRRGGPYGKECPFTSFVPSTANAADSSGGDSNPMDWGDIDRILFRLSRSAAEEAQRSSDPVKGLLRRELMDNLQVLLGCLGKRERQIFEAHFFGELSPAEIAAMFETTTANVYNLLSRSRSKVQKERIRVSIRLYVQRRAELGLKRVNILPAPQL
ncbi:RNA polymerase sigma factor [Paenibacillus eucommiae]|uniref:RNA polymerase sigma factor n=1 Tax=Paenibacillus eucommiae TaxID=1355755 RepID=A0ABS4J4Q2_9BACL|nr:sigma-70 family RNA polymerase sigma factor [Paenibacillus eucommiae]MBP1993764.1 RNA polymerase sigma factor (sigma-70 family) [Paenibacillus eucommiae]